MPPGGPGQGEGPQFRDPLIPLGPGRSRSRNGDAARIDNKLRPRFQSVPVSSPHAGLVGRAEAWEWSSLHGHAQGPLALWLDPGPVPRGPQWVEAVNAPMFETELAPIRRSLQRAAPFGSEAWTLQTAIALGLESSLKPLGRSRTTADQGEGI